MKNKLFKPLMYSVGLICLVAVLSCVLMQDKPSSRTTQSIQSSHLNDMYLSKVQPIFNQRCIACHSCSESPCQLNLQSFEGIERGGIQGSLVYSGGRRSEAALTRLFEDAHSTDDWRAMGFYDIIGSSGASILLESVKLASSVDRNLPVDVVKVNQYCAKSMKDFSSVENAKHKMSMPYGLPALASEQENALKEWVAAGAPGPRSDLTSIPDEMQAEKSAWESFLNQTDLRTKWVARYLYEHLFLASFYVDPKARHYLKMIRSSTPCSRGPKVIATRRPNDKPPVDQWYYCFIKTPAVTVDKTNIPYSLSIAKLNWIKKNFLEIDWKPEDVMDYSVDVASNPFKAFKAIPISARYRFLLEDAHYHISTFIKGPVCNGTSAVNSIQEQFYTFFVKPESDLMAHSAEYANQVVDQLVLPGQWGSKVDILKMIPEYQKLIEQRNQYRLSRGTQLQKLRPNGLTLDDLWNGDGVNDNAVLTILRHDDNARVVKGAFGDLSKTAFVLDYSLFERLVYNLVVNFDVYGNVGHQFLTRVYMDLIRMEAENNFLDFLPPTDRLQLKKKWYQGLITSQKLSLFDENQFSPIPSGVQFSKGSDSQMDLVRQILFTHLSEKVRGPEDPINWKRLKPVTSNDQEINQLARISSTQAPFVRLFPEISILVIKENNVPKRAYSIIRNRQLKNVSWIMFEGQRLDPAQDTLMIGRGYYSSYPNQFFLVESTQLGRMMDEILKVKDQGGYDSLINSYGIKRMDAWMWPAYDFMVQDFINLDPLHAGYLDLSRYKL